MNSNQHLDDADVRGWLGGVQPAEPWPTSFDANEAIRQAQSRRRRHHAGAAVCAAAVVLAAAAAVPVLAGRSGHGEPVPPWHASATAATAGALTVTRCTMADLPVPAGLGSNAVTLPPRVFVTAMDRTGAYVAGNAFGAHNEAAAVILWHDTAPTVLSTGGLGTIMMTAAVNSSGVVAGTGEGGAEAAGFAWVYRQGAVTKLPNVAGYDRLVQVYAVNEAGDVLGSAQQTAGSHSIVVLWPAARPNRPEVQDALTDKLGQLVGATFGDDRALYAWSQTETTPAVWSRDGQRRTLPLPAGFSVGAVTGVRGSWAFGVALAQVPRPNRSAVPVRWNLRTGAVEVIAATVPNQQETIMPAFVTTEVTANGASVLGYVALGGNANGRVFVLPTPDGAANPVAVNDGGTVVAGSVGPTDNNGYTGRTRPAVWHC